MLAAPATIAAHPADATNNVVESPPSCLAPSHSWFRAILAAVRQEVALTKCSSYSTCSKSSSLEFQVIAFILQQMILH